MQDPYSVPALQLPLVASKAQGPGARRSPLRSWLRESLRSSPSFFQRYARYIFHIKLVFIANTSPLDGFCPLAGKRKRCIFWPNTTETMIQIPLWCNWNGKNSRNPSSLTRRTNAGKLFWLSGNLSIKFVYRWDYSGLVNTPNARYRTFLMVLMAFFGQWSGNGLG